MTLQVKIVNHGNQESDTLVLKGFKFYDHNPEPNSRFVDFTGDPNDIVTLLKGQEIIFSPPTAHFDDFETCQMKGKH